MNSIKSIFTVIGMLFVVTTAVLVLMTIFDLAGSEETQRFIIKLAQASGVVAATALVLLGLTHLNKR
jgi:hypothetical protein